MSPLRSNSRRPRRGGVGLRIEVGLDPRAFLGGQAQQVPGPDGADVAFAGAEAAGQQNHMC